MKVVLKPLALFGLAGLVSLGGWWLVDSTQTNARQSSLLAGPFPSFGTRGRPQFRDLHIAQSVLSEVEETYVEPHRVDYDAMYEAALEAVERRVPTALFRRVEGSDLVHVQVGDHLGVLEVGHLETSGALLRALRETVAVVEDHVDPEDVRIDEGDDPLAAIEYALVNGMLDTLDPHSRLLPPEDSREMDVENSGEFGGLGITIVDREGQLTIDYPLPDTPASRAGLQADDRIVRIDGESTINMSLDEAVDRLRGRVGDAVVLTVERDNEAEPLSKEIERARIKMNPVEGDLLDGGVGIVSIKSFHANVAADLETELARLSREVPGGRLKGLILDLRSNPGGYLNQAVSVADRFLEEGVIVTTMGRGREDEREEARASRTEPRYPIAVLVNYSSASASEIVAGALRYHDRAVIVGERTFGKGSVQNLEGFYDGSKLKLTIAKYYARGDKSIQSVGIPADFELVPAVVEPAEDADDVDVALMYWRERVRREADFDNHLERQPARDESSVYSLRYLRPQDLRRRGPTLEHLRGDPEVRFARDVLIAAQGSYRRPDILASAYPVVQSYRRQGARDIERAFRDLGVDWSASPNPPLEGAQLDVSLDLGEDGQLVAGTEETIWLEVTNRGDQPVYRLAAVSSSDDEILDGREFFFGRLGPGETLRYAQEVVLNDGYPTEETPVTVTFRDGTNDELATWDARLPVKGLELPRLAYRWTVDDAVGGDGDGLIELGESVEIKLTVENDGTGPTAEAFARMKNRSRNALDLVRGTVEPGTMRAADGSECEVLVGGVESGNLVHGPEAQSEETARRVAAGEPPSYAEGCERTLLPGEIWSGTFLADIKQRVEVWSLDLSVGDARAYDHATVMRAGFYDTFTNKTRVRFSEGGAEAGPTSFEPPMVTVSRAPGTVVERDRVTLSGMVADDTGIAHVTVWHGDEKVALADGGGLTAIPFSVDVVLDDGLNTLAIVATDTDGQTHTRSVVTSYEPKEVQAKVDPEP